MSIVIPVYETEESLDRLLRELAALSPRMPVTMEAVFVVDGSTDRSLEILRTRLPQAPYPWQLLSLSRNFGSWAAATAGLQQGRGDYFATLAADLQEPPDLMIRFAETLASGRADIVIAHRQSRSDPWLTRISSNIFWAAYRRLVVKDIPPGGADVFAVTREVRDVLINFRESSTSLLALLFWIGFRRSFVSYVRAPRLEGKSAWTLPKKLRLAANSVLNFSDLPLQLLLFMGGLGMGTAVVYGTIVLLAKLLGRVDVPGYAALIVAITFFGGLTSMGLGIIGQYLWLVLQNVRHRPNYIIAENKASDLFASVRADSSLGEPQIGQRSVVTTQ
ncbi:MAG: glycosyltransferase family 2 protein [Candidatus Eremiobacteraeota bacterium]|nr:glycosyltransferase family 2 protein [Candidatus Eremiobacteraeota bacterium]